MVTAGVLPFGENSHGRAENRTWDLMISSQTLWPLDHEAGLKAYPKVPGLATTPKIEILHTFMTADASVPLLLSFVKATFCVEIKLCLFLCVLRVGCIFRKNYFRKQCIVVRFDPGLRKLHRTRKKYPKDLSVTMLRGIGLCTGTWGQFG